MPWLGGVKGACLLIKQSGHRGEGGYRVLWGERGSVRCAGGRPRNRCGMRGAAQSSRLRCTAEPPGVRLEGVKDSALTVGAERDEQEPETGKEIPSLVGD